MLSSLQTVRHSQMQNVSEKNIYTPMTPNLARNVQNPIHIIPEDVNYRWIRGGQNSRQTVKDMDYFSSNYDNPTIMALLRAKKNYMF